MADELMADDLRSEDTVRGEPDLLLLVSEKRHRDGLRALGYLVKARDPRLGLNFDSFDSPPFRRDPLVHFEQLFSDIEAMARGDGVWGSRPRHAQSPGARPAGSDMFEERLASLGVQLFEELFPEDLQRRLWSVHRQVRTLQILSEEAWIPWQLLKLQDPDDDASAGPFFVEAFAMTRWLKGRREVRELPLRRLAFVAPEDSELPDAAVERRALAAGGPERRVTEVEARYDEVIRELASGRHDGWHFAGHGFAAGDAPNRWRVELEAGQTLTPVDLRGPARRLGRAAPLVFLNACHSGRGAFSLTGLGGLASAFLKAGAGAFIGSHWALRDDRARLFAEVFYQRFFAGETLGEAVRQARRRLRQDFPRDPDWLAYTVYGHPLVRCVEVLAQSPREDAVEAPASDEPDTTVATESPGRVERRTVPAGESRAPTAAPEISTPRARSVESGPNGDVEPLCRRPSPGAERIHPTDGTVLLYVPGGDRVLGARDVHEWARPVHHVHLSPFWIGKFPVTNEQYGRFLESNPGRPEPRFWRQPEFAGPRQPVVGVSWMDADAYCRWAGLGLPSEAQWEAAARGTDQRRYPWGDQPPSDRHANFGGRLGKTSPAGSFPAGAGPYGTLDSAGNVWEWCADAWVSTAYKGRDSQRDPVASGDPAVRVVRGGAWLNPPKDLRAAYRDRGTARMGYNYQGFRCVWRPDAAAGGDPRRPA